MSSHPATTVPPFELKPLDEKTQLRALGRALELAEGFTLLFARCNLYDQRQRLIAALKACLPAFNIQEIHFREPIPHLLDALREQIAEPAPDAVFVSGLENSLPTAADAQNTPFVANLNASRNSFPRVVPCPLVLWVPEYVLVAVVRGAPDFFSVRSGVYFFASTPQDTEGISRFLLGDEEWQAANLPLDEKLERITTIQGLVQDYQALPSERRDYRAEARLLNRLANLYTSLGQWTQAEAAIQQVLQITRALGERANEAAALCNLGSLYQHQGLQEKASEAYRQSLEIARMLGDYAGEGHVLYNLGSLLANQGNLQEAEGAYKQSLDLAYATRDLSVEMRALGNLSGIYFRRGQYAEAEEAIRRCIAICREMRDRIGEGQAIYNLSLIYFQQGGLEEAEEAGLQCLTIFRELGIRINEALMLSNLGLIYQRQGRLAEAEKGYRQSIKIYHELGMRGYEAVDLHNLSVVRAAQGDAKESFELQQQAARISEPSENEEKEMSTERSV